MKYDPPEFSTAAELGCPFVLDQVRSYYVFCRCIAFLSLLSLLIRKVNITGDLLRVSIIAYKKSNVSSSPSCTTSK